MINLKSVAQRGTSFIAAMTLLSGVGTSLLPAFASADALNPLTERTLSLSSSSPGWSFTDGSGNSTYAWPGSGANGQKSGETFSFKVSTNSTVSPTVKAFTFQYCTSAAGLCRSPGNGTGAGQSNFEVVTSSPAEVSSSDWTTIQSRAENANPLAGLHYHQPKTDSTEGNFVVLVGGTYSGGWTMAASNVEDGTSPTGENNFITLKNSTGINPAAGTAIKVIFFATNTNYITNPGAGAFFVKINNYNSDNYQNFRDAYPQTGNICNSDHTTYNASGTHTCNTNVIDGGVTVANVMNESIAIQTKVLETMDFSVGTVDPDTLTDGTGNERDDAGIADNYGQCDPILTAVLPGSEAHNVLNLGNPDAENSLETAAAWATHSYWRLSSNSSGGATVYYTGATLSNTVGDQIAPIGTTAHQSQTGTEQFGLAIDNINSGSRLVNYDSNDDPNDWGADNHGKTTNDGALDANFATYVTTINADAIAHAPRLAPLVPETAYAEGAGAINTTDPNWGTLDAKFAFDPNANSVAVPLASENTEVVNCVTAKMRYIGNIAATTPAGIYTTKINYVASPQY